MSKYSDINKDVECIVTTSTSGKPGKGLRIDVHADEVGFEEMPWELRPDPDEDQEIERLEKELRTQKRQLLIHVVGLTAYIGGAVLGLSLGDYGWTVVLLMTIAMFCMDRS
jgi:hypothetical protein